MSLKIPDLIQKLTDKKVKALDNGNSKKVIDAREVKAYLSKGLEYGNTLPGNKEFTVKLPS
ncbi:MAG: hypothetical protein ACYCSO_09945 [Cuniculiplasma sp.]